MQPELIRTYDPKGSNGKIFSNDRLMLFGIELPRKENQAGVSCIPEGRYELVKRWSLQFGRFLQLMNVPQQNDKRIHPANNALQELETASLPYGDHRCRERVRPRRDGNPDPPGIQHPCLHGRVFLIIKSKPYECS